MSNISEAIKNLIIEYIEFPDQLELSSEQGENSYSIQIKAPRTDLGKIIGRNGRNIKALTTLVNAISATKKITINLHIIS
jgi:predicted RNA-binding protein YlqC (UPF0109 family)